MEAVHESGQLYTFHDPNNQASLKFPMSLTLSGNYAITFVANDSLGNQNRSAVVNYNFGLNKPVAVISSVSQISDVVAQINMGSSLAASPTFIQSYQVIATHESGTISSTSTSSPFPQITLPHLGLWDLQARVIDNLGNASDYVSASIVMGDFNQLPIASFFAVKQFGSNTYDLNAMASFDPDGYISNYTYTLTSPAGIATELSTSEPLTSFHFGEAGQWSVQLIVMDNEGGFSAPLNLYVNVFEQTTTEFDYQVSAIDNINYKIQFVFPDTSDFVDLNLSLNSTEIYSGTNINSEIEFPPFSKTGTYILVITYHHLGETTTYNDTIAVYPPAIGDDIIPDPPGADADSTLLGIDSDNDGVRDDIELWINSKTTNLLQNAALKNYAKTLQKQLQSVTNEEASIAAVYEEISYEYCLIARLGRDSTDTISADMKIEFYNTEERLLTWAQIQGNFGGQVVTLDTDEANYANYCD